RCRLGRAAFVAELHGLPLPPSSGTGLAWLGDEAGWIAAFRLADAIRAEARAAADDLRRLGFTLHLLTGDERKVAEAVANELGIDRIGANATPEAKQGYV